MLGMEYMHFLKFLRLTFSTFDSSKNHSGRMPSFLWSTFLQHFSRLLPAKNASSSSCCLCNPYRPWWICQFHDNQDHTLSRLEADILSLRWLRHIHGTIWFIIHERAVARHLGFDWRRATRTEPSSCFWWNVNHSFVPKRCNERSVALWLYCWKVADRKKEWWSNAREMEYAWRHVELSYWLQSYLFKSDNLLDIHGHML